MPVQRSGSYRLVSGRACDKSEGCASGSVSLRAAGQLFMASAFAGALSADVKEDSSPTGTRKVHFPTGGSSCATISNRKGTYTMPTLLDHDDGTPFQSF